MIGVAFIMIGFICPTISLALFILDRNKQGRMYALHLAGGTCLLVGGIIFDDIIIKTVAAISIILAVISIVNWQQFKQRLGDFEK